MGTTSRLAPVGLMLGLVLMLAACTDEAGQATSGAGTVEAGATSTNATSTTATSATAGSEETSTTTAGGTTSTDAGDSEELPGDFFDIGPGQGDRLDVVNVRFDDVLNFRVLPDPSATIVDTVAPRSNSPVVLSAGEGRLLARSAWWRVTVDGDDAWANFAFLGMLGSERDVLNELVDALGTDGAASLDDLVTALAEARAGGDPELRVTFVSEVEELASGRSQVIVDLTGLADDAAKGDRLVLLFETIGDDPDGPVRLVGATRAPICSRGLSDGRCV